jgi:hypothetical protein
MTQYPTVDVVASAIASNISGQLFNTPVSVHDQLRNAAKAAIAAFLASPQMVENNRVLDMAYSLIVSMRSDGNHNVAKELGEIVDAKSAIDQLERLVKS